MTTRPTIVIPDEHLAPCLHLYGNSALIGCTTLGAVGTLTAVIADRSTHTLSSGEQRLWAALTVLAAGESLTEADLTAADYALDTKSAAAVRSAAGQVVA